jgi:hypothetical protein
MEAQDGEVLRGNKKKLLTSCLTRLHLSNLLSGDVVSKRWEGEPPCHSGARVGRRGKKQEQEARGRRRRRRRKKNAEVYH